MFVPVAKILKRYKLVKVFHLLFYSAILSIMVLYHKNFVTTVSVDLAGVSFDILIVVQFSVVKALCSIATTSLVLVAAKEYFTLQLSCCGLLYLASSPICCSTL